MVLDIRWLFVYNYKLYGTLGKQLIFSSLKTEQASTVYI
jgi:hypothetical protein